MLSDGAAVYWTLSYCVFRSNRHKSQHLWYCQLCRCRCYVCICTELPVTQYWLHSITDNQKVIIFFHSLTRKIMWL